MDTNINSDGEDSQEAAEVEDDISEVEEEMADVESAANEDQLEELKSQGDIPDTRCKILYILLLVDIYAQRISLGFI